MYLFLDTETTGLPLFNQPSEDPGQPRIASIAMILTDDVGKIKSQFYSLIKRDGWEVDQFITDLTGITNEDLDAYGISMKSAWGIFCHMAKRAGTLVCHNDSFDRKMLKIEARRLGLEGDIEELVNLAKECTLRQTINICQLPKPDGKKGFKWPKLEESYRTMFGKDFEGAHNALTDTIACKEIFFAVLTGSPPCQMFAKREETAA